MHLSPITGGGLTLPPAWSASAIPPLPAIDGSPPTIRVALPDGGQTQLPGVAESERVDAQRAPAAREPAADRDSAAC